MGIAKLKNQLEMGAIDRRPDGYHVITSINRATNEIKSTKFDYCGDAIQYVHDFSLFQFPLWHKQNCLMCRQNEKA
jgi:hypothetical protein